jgi:hypothetical protein
MELHPEVSLAIELAARDVSRAFADHYSRSADYASLKRTIGGFISMAVSKATMSESIWTDSSSSTKWTRSADDSAPGTVEPKALEQAINKWWKTLDDTTKLEAIMNPDWGAGHHDSEYMNNIKQKFQGKPLADLGKVPELDAAYREETGVSGQPPATPKPAPVKPISDVAPSQPSAPIAPISPVPSR